MKEVKTTYLEILNQVNEEYRTEVPWESLFNATDLNYPNALVLDFWDEVIDISRIKAYQVYKYIVDNNAICGLTTIFLDDTLVATVTKKYTKHREEVEFLHSESYKQLKKYLFELAIEHDYPHQDAVLTNVNREIEGIYFLDSIDELCHSYALLEGDIVEIRGRSENGKVKVIRKDKSTVEVDIKELVFKYNMP